MRELLAIFLLLLCPSAFGQTFELLQAATPITTDTDTYTFSSQNLGTAAANRYIIAAAGVRQTGAISFSSITINGVTATQAVTTNNGSQDRIALAIANVPSGTSGDVVVTCSGTALRCGLVLYRATGLTSATPTDTGTSTAGDPTDSLTVPNGFVIGLASSTPGTTATWTGATEDYDAQLEGGFFTMTAASDTTTTGDSPLTLTCDFASPSGSAGVFASWELSEASSTLPLIHYYRSQMSR